MGSDRDTTPFLFALTGEGSGDFIINMTSGLITSARILDYEQTTEYPNLVLVVYDGDFLNNTVPLLIAVQDINDNTPTFAQNRVDLTIPEDTSIGDEIFVAIATDLDFTSNGQVTYSLEDQARRDFSINSLSGGVTVNSVLDYETTTGYLLVITASDGGSPSRNSSLTLNLTISDTNDNSPVISNPMPVYNFTENIATRTLVGNVRATDIDSGSNSILVYAITAGNEAGRFYINPTTGDIFVNGSIDREEQSMYSLTVEVM